MSHPDRLAELKTMKSLVEASIHATDADKRAPLVNQWRALEAQIAALDADTAKAGDPVDDLAARRASRGGATSRLGHTTGRAR